MLLFGISCISLLANFFCATRLSSVVMYSHRTTLEVFDKTEKNFQVAVDGKNSAEIRMLVSSITRNFVFLPHFRTNDIFGVALKFFLG